jgi:DHA2 family multidrug resistance protein
MPFVAKLSKIDNRILCTFGLLLFGGSCLMNAYMDATTGYDQLLLSQVACAGPAVRDADAVELRHERHPAQGHAVGFEPDQHDRNLGGSIGIALLATALTNREHFHSVRIGESVTNLRWPRRSA